MSKKLLLADDSVVIQKLVGLSFANEDVEIVSTDNGDDAVTLAQEIQPDVVLADVVMPGKSGYEVCEAIKQDPSIGQTPVLLLTGTFEAFDEGRAASAGANGQITKPFEAQALVERVTEVMNAPRPAAQAAPAAAAKPAAAPPSPIPEPPLDPAETVVSSIPGSTSDLFDNDISSLSPPPIPGVEDDLANDDLELDLDGSPDFFAEAGRDTSASALFGAPGEGASDLLDTAGGDLVIGQSVAPKASEPAAEPVEPAEPRMPEDQAETLAPMAAPARTEHEAPKAPTSPPIAEDATIAMAPELSASDAGGPDLAEFGSALDAVPSETTRGLAIGTDDINASTSPSFEAAPDTDPNAISARAAEPAKGAGPVETASPLTVHAPSADIDTDRSEAPMPPAVEPPPAALEQPTVVADLDIALSSPAGATTRDPLAIASQRPDQDDLDIAFDVSEQAAVRDETDPLADSFSSLMDISEASILGHRGPDLDERDEALGVGFDVSSSDLATAEPEPIRDDVPTGPTAPEPLIDLPELPKAHMADRAEDLVGDEPAGIRDSVEEPALEEAMPEPLPEVQAEHTFSSSQPASQTVFDEPTAGGDSGVGGAAPIEPSVAMPEEPSTASAQAPDFSPEASFSQEPETGNEAKLDAEPEETPVIELPEDTLGPQSGIGRELLNAPEADTSERRVADLSPLVEQRIQESLEKVAWEAFSDLSETIVKQVLDRVEQVAWEVIPQMAETLVREEIRKMKGEDD